MDTAQVLRTLDQLAEMGTFFLTLSGGEIFLRPDLFTILEYGRRRNFALSLFCTGNYGLGEDRVRALAELGIEALVVSLYSLEARVHDRITGVPGSWAGLFRTIKLCQSLGVRLIFNCMVLQPNYKGVPALRDWAAREGIIVRFDEELTPRWDGQPHPPGLALSDAARKYLNETNPPDAKQTYVDLGPSLAGCGAGMYGCYLGATGELWPCIDFPWHCGNLQNGGDLRTAWQDSPEMHQVRNLRQQLTGNDRLCDGHRKGCKNFPYLT